MAVSAFLGQVDICLIPYKEFMTAIAGTEFGGVCLVTVTKHYPMETTAYQHGNRSVSHIGKPIFLSGRLAMWCHLLLQEQTALLLRTDF